MRVFAILVLLFGLSACAPEPPPPAAMDDHAPVISNRIDVSPQVIENLGITFARAERRHVEQTLRVPGHFESPPEAMREYRTMLPGRVELLVAQYDHVKPGTPLFTLDSPEWREWQDRMATAEADVTRQRAQLEVLKAERAEARESVSTWPLRLQALEAQIAGFAPRTAALAAVSAARRGRVQSLQQAGKAGGVTNDELRIATAEAAEAEAAEAEAANDQEALVRERMDMDADRRAAVAGLPVFDARILAAQADIELGLAALGRLVESAAAVLGVSTVDAASWRSAGRVTITATAPGRVLHLDVTSGAWVEGSTGILATVDTSMMRFRAKALQSDLGLLRDGQPAVIAPPLGGSLESAAPVKGALHLGLEARSDSRVLDLIVKFDAVPEWARPGVTAEAEVVYATTEEPELAVPLRCVVRDGLERVIFVRDPDDPGKVIRETPLFGPDDGRWIVLYSGVMAGSEVVQDGVYELKLASGNKPGGGGHFHADGTWHADGH